MILEQLQIKGIVVQQKSMSDIRPLSISTTQICQTNSLADPAVGFGGGQLGEVTQARVPPKLKTPRIWPTIFWEWPKITYKKNIKKENKKVRLQVPGLSWKSMVSPVKPRFVLRGCDLFCWALVCHEEI